MIKKNSFLNTFFNQLSLRNIKYSVLRNYQQLPYSTGGSDLDMLVDKSDGVSSRACILNSLLDGFNCRKNAGMGLLSNAVSFFIRFLIFFCYRPILTLLNKNGK